MDFGSLLHAAQKNANSNTSSENKKYYSTKFEPPKKESKEKKLSDNIKKFLAQREVEERRKEQESKRKYNELMAQRSDRDKNKIKKMLKVTKSANRSVLDDAVDNANTAVTLQGPEQPDEDDYGYVSHEASALYKNLMDKYKTIPEEKKFSDAGRHGSKTDLSTTKDRVRAAIMREREDEKLGRKRSAPSSSTSVAPTSTQSSEHRHRSRKNLYDPQQEKEEQERRRREEEEQKRKARLKKAPPPMLDFKNLLKLAEQKQHEPLEIEVPTKTKEPERLLTSKEKREMEEKRAYLAEKERRRNMPAGAAAKANPTSEPGKTVNKMAPNGRIPKLNATEAKAPTSCRPPADMRKSPSVSNSAVPKPLLVKPKSDHNKSAMRPPTQGKSTEILRSTLIKSSTTSQANGNRKSESKSLPKDTKTREFPPKDIQRSTKDLKTKSTTPSKDVKPREFPPRDVAKTREFPPRDVVRTREFPPRDVHRNGVALKRKPMPPPKRRILDDDDDESDYDSEMDDFIDDDPQENDYSKYIKEIFGYDKSRYRYDDDDCEDMETNFAQQQREEYLSKKAGLLEDLEDMRQEAAEKARKEKRRRRS